MSFPPISSSSPVVHRSYGGQSQAQRAPGLPNSSASAPGSSASGTQPLTLMDEYLLASCPGYTPMPKEQLEEWFRYQGATDETMQSYYEAFNRMTEARMGPSGPGFRVVGLKPRPGDNNVYTVDIPGTDLIIRMWEGGMDYYSLCYLDFFDTRRQVSVNLPRGFSLHPAGHSPMPGAAGMPGAFYLPPVYSKKGAMPSWEEAFGFTRDQIPPGEEKWTAPAGSHVSVVKDGRALVTFAVPLSQAQRNMMPTVVQPTLGYRR